MARVHSHIALAAVVAGVALVGSSLRSPWPAPVHARQHLTLTEFLHWSPHFFNGVGDRILVFRAKGRFEDLCRLDPAAEVRQFWVHAPSDRFSSNIHDGNIELLPRLESIEILSLSDSPGITDASLPQLARMPQLRRLAILGTSITDDGWAWLFRERPDIQLLQ